MGETLSHLRWWPDELCLGVDTLDTGGWMDWLPGSALVLVAAAAVVSKACCGSSESFSPDPIVPLLSLMLQLIGGDWTIRVSGVSCPAFTTS